MLGFNSLINFIDFYIAYRFFRCLAETIEESTRRNVLEFILFVLWD